ncbi:transmembrane adaptor Erv26 [Saitoella complicata NRRL Y-17804]|uniref:Protein SVP26 n=1 Tax=Saitoella complicata (strain BCRC 22490 / CBS 7301 / JCM 7358 / NBRC 10748 / NRRL Y-17804) TaxID=698492 RepID=A0A0E9NBP4_SAICN|nr:transmembrane adaptor Erv26 [Saitoella complicata NRRL Y-17804]ODQ55287.1 transmembrane adaptor Erv26 [Saitoella complicata NRRL Y-17804]GAO47121.1 hypothetical protein G7K_1332-t1 [Saitoella complicata NRRL Y-17804]
MWILTPISYLGGVLGFIFLTLSVASGLYYMSEFVEEHSQFSKRIIRRIIYAILATHVLLLLLDGFPFFLTIVGIVCHVVYLTNLASFPYINLSSPQFIASGVLVFLDHFLWFRHFSTSQSIPNLSPGSRFSSSNPLPSAPSFAEIASFFGLCVWLVPVTLFVSLSAGEMVLPTIGADGVRGTEMRNEKRTGLVKTLYRKVGEGLAQVMETFGWGREGELPRSGRFV